jgi:hypothetical protein
MSTTKYDIIVAQVHFMNELLYSDLNKEEIIKLVNKYIMRYKKLNVELELIQIGNIHIVKINNVY